MPHAVSEAVVLIRLHSRLHGVEGELSQVSMTKCLGMASFRRSYGCEGRKYTTDRCSDLRSISLDPSLGLCCRRALENTVASNSILASRPHGHHDSAELRRALQDNGLRGPQSLASGIP